MLLIAPSGSSKEGAECPCEHELSEYMRGPTSSDSDSESDVIHPEEDPEDEPVSSTSEAISEVEDDEPVLKELCRGDGATEGG